MSQSSQQPDMTIDLVSWRYGRPCGSLSEENCILRMQDGNFVTSCGPRTLQVLSISEITKAYDYQKAGALILSTAGDSMFVILDMFNRDRLHSLLAILNIQIQPMGCEEFFHLQRKLTFPVGLPIQDCESKYQIGDRVRVRNGASEQWKVGTVATLRPLKVKVDGWSKAHMWKEVTGLTQPASAPALLTKQAPAPQSALPAVAPPGCIMQRKVSDSDEESDGISTGSVSMSGHVTPPIVEVVATMIFEESTSDSAVPLQPTPPLVTGTPWPAAYPYQPSQAHEPVRATRTDDFPPPPPPVQGADDSCGLEQWSWAM